MSELDSTLTSAGNDIPAPAATPATPSVEPAIPASGPQGQAQNVPPENYVPSYRLREARESAIRQAQEQYTSQLAERDAMVQHLQSQLQALTGVQAPADPQIEQIRNQFAQLFPRLAQFESMDPDRLSALLDQAGDFEQANQHYWQSYGRQTLNTLFSQAETALGGQLNDNGRSFLHQQFVGWLSASPERVARYEVDPSIVNDFMQEYQSNIIDPVRRGATAQVASRAPQALPQDRPGGAPAVSQAPKPKDLDARTDLAWSTFQRIKQG